MWNKQKTGTRICFFLPIVRVAAGNIRYVCQIFVLRCGIIARIDKKQITGPHFPRDFNIYTCPKKRYDAEQTINPQTA